MKIYIAAPLFNEAERAFNLRIDAILRECGHETFLPQREGGCVADLPETMEGMPIRKYLFRLDCEHMTGAIRSFSWRTAASRMRAPALSWDTALRRESGASPTRRTPAPSSMGLTMS